MTKCNRNVATLLTTILLLVACASTPAGKYSQLNDSFIAVTTTLVEARVNGLIDDETWSKEVLPLINRGSQLLDKQREIIDDGGDPYELNPFVEIVVDQLLVYTLTIERSE